MSDWVSVGHVGLSCGRGGKRSPLKSRDETRGQPRWEGAVVSARWGQAALGTVQLGPGCS